jgi:hypothetical protein
VDGSDPDAVGLAVANGPLGTIEGAFLPTSATTKSRSKRSPLGSLKRSPWGSLLPLERQGQRTLRWGRWWDVQPAVPVQGRWEEGPARMVKIRGALFMRGKDRARGTTAFDGVVQQ